MHLCTLHDRYSLQALPRLGPGAGLAVFHCLQPLGRGLVLGWPTVEPPLGYGLKPVVFTGASVCHAARLTVAYHPLQQALEAATGPVAIFEFGPLLVTHDGATARVIGQEPEALRVYTGAQVLPAAKLLNLRAGAVRTPLRVGRWRVSVGARHYRYHASSPQPPVAHDGVLVVDEETPAGLAPRWIALDYRR